MYTGNFYLDRTPEGLFKALNFLNQTRPLKDQLEVDLIGQNTQLYQTLADGMGLGGVVKCKGPCSFSESLREAGQADILLVIDAPSNTSSPFLPSKIVDYLPFKKPILGLTPLSGATADLLYQLGCPVVAPDNALSIASVIEGLIQLWQSQNLQVSTTFDQVACNYDIQKTTRILDGVLERVVRKDRIEG